MENYFPGTRVLVFDWHLYRDDVSTPIIDTLNLATVKCWYGSVATSSAMGNRRYKSLIDVEFDHKPGEISKAHIAHHIRIVETKEDVDKVVVEVVTNANLTMEQGVVFRKKLLAGVGA